MDAKDLLGQSGWAISTSSHEKRHDGKSPEHHVLAKDITLSPTVNLTDLSMTPQPGATPRNRSPAGTAYGDAAFFFWPNRTARQRCHSAKGKKTLEARGRIELPIKVLQTFALPLGDRALETRGVFYNSI